MMWHVLCGDVAARQLSPLIKRNGSAQIKVLRDDLAVGPLQDVDMPPCAARAAFWQAVWPEEASAELDLGSLSSDVRWLQALPQQPYSVTVWHGDSASEQLMLARVAFWLGESPVSVQEVKCGTGESHTGGRRAVSMCAPAQLAAFVPQAVSMARRQQLAGHWSAQRASASVLRCWRAGQLLAGGYEVPDAALMAACDSAWRPLPAVMAAVMEAADGYFPTDYFVYWRARVLAAQGQVVIEGDAGKGYSGLRVRRPA
ncbi:DUF1835 domain-containing protein [Alcanivorax sp. S71-1-4]|uniref:DUF1835 domain-containing protein n=1 Tax=Alcanivorax sp. S71-1-4 TaxID=1177159 RepID=UPI001915D893|nr:DUF1835 domain-containing protein [Alcanivorax sp. S71-1-4]